MGVMLKKTTFWVMLAQAPLAWDWFKAGWDKFSEGSFGTKFADELPSTLARFGQQKNALGETITNPNTWYVNTFLSWAQSNPKLFGYMVVYGELALGLILFIAVGYYLLTQKALPKILMWLVILGLAGGVVMNLNYYFASGWPESAISGRSLNILMLLSQIIFIGYYLFAHSNTKE